MKILTEIYLAKTEFRIVLNALNINKAPGIDGIPGIAFKSFSD